jgi:DNA-binding GntR family transcriptional regulator
MTNRGTELAASGLRRIHLDAARHVLDMVVREGLKSGDHLSEQLVADRAGVSRTPARGALRLLEHVGIVERRANRGYFLCNSTYESLSLLELPKPDDDALYLQIARDWFEGRLPETVTQSDLSRRFNVGRVVLSRTLMRLAEDDIVMRAPSQGWTFLPTLNTEHAHDASYRFRRCIEPAAILEPTFALDEEAARLCRMRHDHVLAHRLEQVPMSTIFDIDAQFHALIARSSKNPFFTAAIERQNRLRRLVEYFAPSDGSRLQASCVEHLEILDLLTQARRTLAAERMRDHLEQSSRIKPVFPLEAVGAT